MQPLHYLNESHLVLFLLQVAILLGLARGIGLCLNRWGQPSISGEILVGLILGPTVFGRFLPSIQSRLFPPDPVQSAMLETVSWLGILLFLLVTGLETDFKLALRRKREAFIISTVDLVLPMAIAFVPCLLLPAQYSGGAGDRIVFAFFVATILTISALPVTARVMQDLKIYKSDVGLLIMTALTINDVVGWVVFAVILGAVESGALSLASGMAMLGWTVAFSLVAFTVGRRLVKCLLAALHRRDYPEPGSSLTLLVVLGCLGGVVTLKIGIHALFGFFVAGIVAGSTTQVTERSRHVIDEWVRAFLVPLFFATVALRIDFAGKFDLFLVTFITVIGVVGRYIGAWVGVWLTGRHHGDRDLISVAHTPGGEMQIVVGLLALECRVISESVFVAIVFGAVLTSVLLGPWMKRSLKRSRKDKLVTALQNPLLRTHLQMPTKELALKELCALVSASVIDADPMDLVHDVLQREELQSTALGKGLAVPHGRAVWCSGPVIAIGHLAAPVEWNAPDGLPVEWVTLIVTSPDEDGSQVWLTRTISSALEAAEVRDELRAHLDDGQLAERLRSAFAQSPWTQGA